MRAAGSTRSAMGWTGGIHGILRPGLGGARLVETGERHPGELPLEEFFMVLLPPRGFRQLRPLARGRFTSIRCPRRGWKLLPSLSSPPQPPVRGPGVPPRTRLHPYG